MMMNIAIDGNEANIDKRVGIGEYAFQLLRTISNNYKNHNFTVYLKQNPLSHMPPQTLNWKYKIIGPKVLWTQVALPLRLFSQNHDLIFSPSHYGPRFTLIPSVISVMDLSYIHYPSLFKKSDLVQLTNWTAYSVKNAKSILTISNFSKKEIVDYYKVAEDKVFVTYPGYKKDIFHTNYTSVQVNGIKKKYGLNKYILFVGTIQPRKNITRLLFAFEKLSKSFPDLKLVLVGKKGWLFEDIFTKIEDLKNRVLYLDYLDDKSLAKLYKGAQAFILPSLYEGFGITVIEAMASGCPVVISNGSSLKEIGGTSAIYIDPLSVDSISSGIINILNMPEAEKKQIIKEGLERIKTYSWEKCAKDTIEVFEDITR